MEKKIIKSINSNILNRNSSELPNIVLEKFLIGTQEQSYSYQEKGNTRYNSYSNFHFGISLINNSENDIKTIFKISEKDKDGYSVRDWNIYGDVDSGDKRRLWGNNGVKSLNDFKNYKLKQVEIKSGNEKFTKNINTTLFQILNLNSSDNLAFKAKSGITWLFKVIITILIIIGLWRLLYNLMN